MKDYSIDQETARLANELKERAGEKDYTLLLYLGNCPLDSDEMEKMPQVNSIITSNGSRDSITFGVISLLQQIIHAFLNATENKAAGWLLVAAFSAAVTRFGLDPDFGPDHADKDHADKYDA